ncbi:MAG: hypothetical protein M1831_004246 [Alyxoria varia]|nr:MAG: hypothetical protein M1831_004246 [Alyxoria varia]
MSEEPWLNPLLLAGVHVTFKLKPSFMTIREYIHHLRVYFPKEHVPFTDFEQTSKARWTQFIEAKTKEQELRAEISRLQSEVSSLTDEKALRASENSKEKKTSHAAEPSNAKGKRRKKPPTADKVLEEAWASLEEASTIWQGNNAVAGNPDTKSFIRHMYHLQQILAQDDPAAEEIAKALIHPLDSAKKLLPISANGNGGRENPSHTRLADMEQDEMGRVCHSLGLTLTVVSTGYSRLLCSEASPEHNLDVPIGVVIHGLLSFFAFLRRRLTACIGELVRVNAPASRSAAASTAKAKVAFQASSTRHETLCSNVTSLLAMFVRVFLLRMPKEAEESQNAETRSRAHERLAEGVLHQLLTRCGALLHIVTFDERALPKTTGGGAFPEPPSDDELRAARMEAKFLSPLIRYTLRSPAVATARKSVEEPPHSETMRARLQATLMRGCFGNEQSTEHLGETLELGLAREDYNKLLEEAESKDKGDEDGHWWFMKEMWEVVGWEILVPQSVYDD